MKTVKIGMVGVGAISGIYLKNIHELFQQIELVGVCDLIPERAQKAKDQYPHLKIYETMYDLFADPEIDIVLNLTRPYEHYDVTKAALEANKHVYSEKPLAATLAEGRDLVRLAEEKHLLLGGAPDTFMGAGIQTCRQLIDDGYIGRVIGANAAMVCHGHEGWHPDPDFYYQHGGGPLFDMGPYYLTALVNLIGGVEKVSGVARQSFDTRTIGSKEHFGETIHVHVPTHVNAILQFANGAVGTLCTTFDVYYPSQARLEIYGEKGTLFVPDPNTFGGPVRILRPEDGVVRDLPLLFDYHENSRALGLTDMAMALSERRDPRAGYQQTLHVLEIMETIYASSNAHQELPIASKYERKMPMKGNLLHGVLD